MTGPSGTATRTPARPARTASWDTCQSETSSTQTATRGSAPVPIPLPSALTAYACQNRRTEAPGARLGAGRLGCGHGPGSRAVSRRRRGRRPRRPRPARRCHTARRGGDPGELPVGAVAAVRRLPHQPRPDTHHNRQGAAAHHHMCTDHDARGRDNAEQQVRQRQHRRRDPQPVGAHAQPCRDRMVHRLGEQACIRSGDLPVRTRGRVSG